MKKISIAVYYILTLMPILWLMLYLLFIVAKGNEQIGFVSIRMFIVTFHSIWIWLVFSTAIYFISKENLFKRRMSFLYYIGTFLFITILFINPGGFLNGLLD
jgi:hypothetical protein